MAITLTEFDDNRIFQRSGTSKQVTISGTYTGTPTNIEYRITDSVSGVAISGHDWQTLEASPTGGTFTGNVTVAQGGFYNTDVRFSNDFLEIDNGVNDWGVGLLVGCIGQSNIANWFSTGTDLTANSLIRKYTSGAWATFTTAGNGAIAFANKLAVALSIPIGLLDNGISGTALRQEASTAGYWLDTVGVSPYNTFITDVTAVGGSLEYIVWSQGERDATSTLVTEAEYKTSLELFFSAQVRTDVTNSSSQTNLPIIISELGKNSATLDTEYQGIRNAQLATYLAGSDLYTTQALDLAVSGGVHYTASGYTINGQRCAQAVLQDLTYETYSRGPSIVSAARTSTTTIKVVLSHSGGSDFTPTTGITGFEVFDDGTPVTVSSAARATATTITLIVTPALSGIMTLRYLYGANPDFSSQVVDNTAMTLPMDWDESITVTADEFAGAGTAMARQEQVIPGVGYTYISSDSVIPDIGYFINETASGGTSVEIPAHNISLTSYAPTISAGGNVNTEIPIHDIGLTSYATTITISDHKSVTIPIHNLSITSYAPTVSVVDAQVVDVPKHDISLTSYAPIVSVSDHKNIEIPGHNLSLTSYTPTVSVGDAQIVDIPKHDISLTSYAPTVTTGNNVEVLISKHDLNLQSYPPSIVISSSVNAVIPKTDINLTSYVPVVSVVGAFSTAPERVFTVPAINRTFIVPAVDRTYTVKRK